MPRRCTNCHSTIPKDEPVTTLVHGKKSLDFCQDDDCQAANRDWVDPLLPVPSDDGSDE